MAATTTISWTRGDDGSPGRAWNPLRGCTRVSAGCQNCYAERLAHRFNGPGQPYAGLTRVVNGHPQWTGQVRLVEEAVEEPLRWRQPVRIFVNSMSDLFHEDVPDAFLDHVFAVMALAGRHTFQVLTKRPRRMQEYLSNRAFATAPTIGCLELERDPGRIVRVDNDETIAPWPLPNVWLGVSVEDQATADERVPELLATPAVVRFISAEPLLGPLDLDEWIHPFRNLDSFYRLQISKGMFNHEQEASLRAKPAVRWIIVGGESGPGARPLDLAWVERIIRDCHGTGAAPFVKQLGAVWAREQRRKGLPADSHGGDWQWWPEGLRVRQFPEGVPA